MLAFQNSVFKLLNDVNEENKSHVDIVSGLRPPLSPIHFVDILCHGEDTIKKFLPQISK